MSKFTHLHVHSEFSLLDGLGKIDKLVDKAVEYGMDALALTDHGGMYGAIKFYTTAQEAGIKPIIGVEAYMAQRSRFDKQAKIDADQYHIILLAKNETGYKNLMKLVSIGHLEGFYYKPRIDLEILGQYHEGLVALSACLAGWIPSLLMNKEEEKALQVAEKFREIFGKDFYLEIQHHPKIKEQALVNERIVKLSRKLGIPLVATNDIHYVEADDAQAQDAMLAIQTQKKVADKDRMTMIDSPDFYMRTQEEMVELFSQWPDAIENTQKISQSCNLQIELGKRILPFFPLPEGKTAEDVVREETLKGAGERYGKLPSEVKKRIDYEIEVIKNKGFLTYFLIVADFVNWAKRNGIRVGPGRGSVAGSLVSYCMRITSIDPLLHNLPFERFLNPERPSPPDIDLDFADDRRDEVIAYVTNKYGKEKVAQIITFGTMEARQAVRDVGRVMGMPYSDPDKIAKLIPPKMNIAKSIESVPELAQLYRQPEYKKLLDLAQRLEGVSRHASTHAAGVVVADQEITAYTPVQREAKGDRVVTQYDMYSLDLNVSDKAVGLLKIDLLGLRNLTILEKAKKFVQENTGEDIDLSELSLDDKKAFELIAEGETTGIFQLESAGMRRLARKLKPNKFSDISAMVALYRPGPMQFINEFIAGKENPEKVKYPHPDLKPILEETYGIAVFQEQCMQIANVMGKYSLGEADILRRAIGKKKKEVMDKEKKTFVKRAQEAGYQKKVAEDVFSLIERFAGYGFNKAHSSSYAMIAYQTAYLKAHYPVEFMAALLTAESSSSSGPIKDEKLAIGVEECRRMGIKVLAPDISHSGVGFSIEKDADSFEGKAIRFGLSAVKNVGMAAISSIFEARKVGDFVSLTDFCQRVDGQKVNKKVLESLIKVGAFDKFGKRSAMLVALDKIRNQTTASSKQKENGQTSLFGKEEEKKRLNPKDELPSMEEFAKAELLSLEKDLLGFYLTEHPLSPLLSLLAQHRTHKLLEIAQAEEFGHTVKVGGIITGLKIVMTRKTAQEMAFVKIEDDTGSIEAVVFPKTFVDYRSLWVKDQVILVEGRVESREDSISLIVNSASSLSGIEQVKEKESDYELEVPANLSPKKLVQLNQLFRQNPGEAKIALAFTDGTGRKRKMILPYGINFGEELGEKIKKILE